VSGFSLTLDRAAPVVLRVRLQPDPRVIATIA
jgi:hypothetical protein